MKLRVCLSLCVAAVVAYAWSAQPIAQNQQIGINVVLNTECTATIATDLSAHGSLLNNIKRSMF